MPSILSHRLFRVYDWLEYKIPQILIPIYLVILNSDYSFNSIDNNIKGFITLLIGVILGATTISIMGEYYDITQDKLAKKKNGFKNLTKKQTTTVLLCTIIINIAFLYIIKTPLLIPYILSIIIFFFYYVPFIRLKEKGVWGVIADSLGSHVFPSLFVFLSLIPLKTILQNEYVVFLLWLFIFGIRGIINHQYEDLENDIKSNTNTFIKTSSEKNRRILQKTIFIIEIISFTLLLALTVPFYIIAIGVLIYLLILFGRKMLFNNAIVFFNITKGRAYSIFLFEFYSIIFPLMLIVQIYPMNKIWFFGFLVFQITLTLKRITSILNRLRESINFILQ